MTTELMAPNAAHGEAIEPGAIRFVRLLPGPIERVWAFLTEFRQARTVARLGCDGDARGC